LRGFDKRLKENREYLEELASREGVYDKVVFLPSCSKRQPVDIISYFLSRNEGHA
jgi:hypothetical protein